ncbi:hypothetical protein K6T82_15175 [Flavobacterium sp. 17A]|uniref:Uncharacterized protein n=1 Tax=Flavobacterium potami TaxID=2872310 RepID=A0A9X1KQP5_9FLAO|nr:hypothetical protein [Flavobacterium potami]MBZ4036113.1 hypothetical protein [Flavobacterium potami]
MKKLVFTAFAVILFSVSATAKSQEMKNVKLLRGNCASDLLSKIEDEVGCLESDDYNALYEYYSQDGMCG